ncbi:MAG: prepilin-type N-terminal cleavage/methylation domain-containing protein [Candidatus Pseudothioglobus sp.]
MKKKFKKSFTLIELLIVVAIIGILAGVGIPMYNGYMASAKINAVKTNEANIKSYIAASFAKCSSGSANLEIGNTTRSCSLTTRQLLQEFIGYFNTINKNPYGLEHVTRLSGYAEPDLGYTNLRDYGDRITIISNIGTVDGGNEFTKLDSITRE